MTSKQHKPAIGQGKTGNNLDKSGDNGGDTENEPWSPARKEEPPKPEINEPGKPAAELGIEPGKHEPPEMLPPKEPEEDKPWSPGREPEKHEESGK